MKLKLDDYRPPKGDLARRYRRTARSIDSWISVGKLPAPYRDESGPPFWLASQIAQHEASLQAESA
jgi:hypothetical protein